MATCHLASAGSDESPRAVCGLWSVAGSVHTVLIELKTGDTFTKTALLLFMEVAVQAFQDNHQVLTSIEGS